MSTSPRVDRATSEIRILGLSTAVAPPLILAVFTFIGFIASDPPRMFTTGLESGIPLGAGLLAASMLAGETALELQLATPPGFRAAAVWRLGAIVAWSSVVAFVAATIARLTGALNSWPGPGDPIRDVSIWLPPIVMFTGLGSLLGVALRSRGAAAAVITGFWMAGLALKDWFLGHDYTRVWYPFAMSFRPAAEWVAVNRLTVLGIGLLCLVASFAWLGRQEWLLGSEDR